MGQLRSDTGPYVWWEGEGGWGPEGKQVFAGVQERPVRANIKGRHAGRLLAHL